MASQSKRHSQEVPQYWKEDAEAYETTEEPEQDITQASQSEQKPQGAEKCQEYQ